MDVIDLDVRTFGSKQHGIQQKEVVCVIRDRNVLRKTGPDKFCVGL